MPDQNPTSERPVVAELEFLVASFTMNVRVSDGWRQFGALPQRSSWYVVRDHVAHLPGATLTKFLCDDVTEAWVDFSYEGHSFTVNDQYGEYWFFVENATCPDPVLRRVLEHFGRMAV